VIEIGEDGRELGQADGATIGYLLANELPKRQFLAVPTLLLAPGIAGTALVSGRDSTLLAGTHPLELAHVH